MFANIFVLLFCALMIWLIYRFKFPGQTNPAHYKWLLLALGFILVVLLVNALFAYLGRGGIQWLIDTRAISSVSELKGRKAREPVIIKGRVSAKNPKSYYDFVVYIDENGFRSTPPELIIDLQDGEASIINTDYQPREWHTYRYDAGDLYLPADQEVIVIAATENDAEAIEQRIRLRAEVLFAGAYEDFLDRAERRVIFPTVMIGLNAVAALCVIILAIALRPS